jgi:predicted O-methyltransferase YrrM
VTDRWIDVDRYISELFVPTDPALDAALLKSAQAGLPAINVAPNQGKMLELLARALSTEKILEIGTLGGYSSIWLARALAPNGKLVTLEIDEGYAEVARENIEHAELSDSVEIRVGPAAESMRQMIRYDEGPFDLIFIDADKAGYPTYLELSLELSRPGTLIVADNVIREGAVIDPDNDDANVAGVKAFLEAVANEPRLDATALQTVGSKGYDGFALLLVTS